MTLLDFKGQSITHRLSVCLPLKKATALSLRLALEDQRAFWGAPSAFRQGRLHEHLQRRTSFINHCRRICQHCEEVKGTHLNFTLMSKPHASELSLLNFHRREKQILWMRRIEGFHISNVLSIIARTHLASPLLIVFHSSALITTHLSPLKQNASWTHSVLHRYSHEAVFLFFHLPTAVSTWLELERISDSTLPLVECLCNSRCSINTCSTVHSRCCSAKVLIT